MDTAVKHSQAPRFEHYDCSAGCPVEAAVNRKVYPVVPPKVEYSLTEKGRDLHAVITALGDWGQKYPREVE